jgi:protein phosphatase
MRLSIPEFSLVLMVGATGSGKSSFAARHFLATEVISSDACRGLVADNPNDQSASADAFEVLRYIAGKRLERRRLTVIDATNVRAEDRRELIHLAREYHALPVAIVLDMPEALCQDRNRARAPTATSGLTSTETTSRLCAGRCAGSSARDLLSAMS